METENQRSTRREHVFSPCKEFMPDSQFRRAYRWAGNLGPELQMRREACGIWPSPGEEFGAAPRPATRASHSISRSSVGTAGNTGNERLSSAIVRRPLCRAHLHTSDGVNPDETIV